ncbi:hypothetical protein ABKA04_005647 [Annulohypoxylon sp. FPYF3050]
MGLGKSLVILSTIAGSLDRANTFVNNEKQLRVSQPLNKVASGATLILVPSSLLIDNWVDEIRKHTNPGTLPFHKHLGPERHKETNLLYERPVVFTTYATVAAESRRGNNTLANINWFRIVLDEAHEIRNRTTKQFQAIASISASHRWCLTGTPIQNSLDDLGALVSFLKNPRLTAAFLFLLAVIWFAIIAYLTIARKVILPLNNLSIDLTRSNNNGIRPAHQYPSKLQALLSDIRQSSTHKSIVFSCWKKTLNLVQELLNISNIRCVMVDGSLPLAQRLKVLKEFRSPTGANILLMTLGTGAVGLNLAIASRIYLLEPQWNPSIESQAIGRALRLGQTAEVVIMRYIVRDTIEDKNVLSRQERKLELAGGGFNKRKDMQPDRLQALQDVFGVNQELIYDR